MNVNLFGTALVALALGACSTQPSQPAAADAPAPVPPSTATRALIAAGYKATAIKGQVYYCRQEDVIGTGFKRKVCLNDEQMRAKERQTKEMQDRMMGTEASPGCLGPTCKDP